MKTFDVTFTKEAWQDYQFFLKTDSRLAERIVRLAEDIANTPKRGIGKPEPLKNDFTGFWSRRIDKKNRLIYRFIDNDTVEIVRCKGHYGNN